MKWKGVSLATVLCVLPACSGGWMDERRDDRSDHRAAKETESPRPPDRCLPEPADWRAAEHLYHATELSVHEMITCGQAQVSLAANLLFVVIASNRDLFDSEALSEIDQYGRIFGVSLDVPFEASADGSWTMVMNAQTGSEFTVRFFEPGSDTPIVEDLFSLESYITGVSATSDIGFDDMRADPNRRATFTYHFEDEGPLARLLNYGEPIPNPFHARLSLWDIVALTLGLGLPESGGPDLGALESVLDIEMSSQINLSDVRGAAHVEYVADIARATVRDVAASGSLDLSVQGIDAASGSLELAGDTESLRFVERGRLAGRIDYTLAGPGVDLVVESDFGSGLSYPKTAWGCP